MAVVFIFVFQISWEPLLRCCEFINSDWKLFKHHSLNNYDDPDILPLNMNMIMNMIMNMNMNMIDYIGGKERKGKERYVKKSLTRVKKMMTIFLIPIFLMIGCHVFWEYFGSITSHDMTWHDMNHWRFLWQYFNELLTLQNYFMISQQTRPLNIAILLSLIVLYCIVFSCINNFHDKLQSQRTTNKKRDEMGESTLDHYLFIYLFLSIGW